MKKIMLVLAAVIYSLSNFVSAQNQIEWSKTLNTTFDYVVKNGISGGYDGDVYETHRFIAPEFKIEAISRGNEKVLSVISETNGYLNSDIFINELPSFKGNLNNGIYFFRFDDLQIKEKVEKIISFLKVFNITKTKCLTPLLSGRDAISSGIKNLIEEINLKGHSDFAMGACIYKNGYKICYENRQGEIIFLVFPRL